MARLAVFLSSAESPRVVTLDASGSYDPEDPSVLLEVRWDWEDDGIWDTPWATVKVAQRPYEDIVPGPVRLQVRDTRGVTNSTSIAVPFASLPLIGHTPVATAAVWQLITITATIEAAEGVAEVQLHYRLEQASEYTTIPMTEEGGGLYSAQIPTPKPGNRRSLLHLSRRPCRGGGPRPVFGGPSDSRRPRSVYLEGALAPRCLRGRNRSDSGSLRPD